MKTKTKTCGGKQVDRERAPGDHRSLAPPRPRIGHRRTYMITGELFTWAAAFDERDPFLSDITRLMAERRVGYTGIV